MDSSMLNNASSDPSLYWYNNTDFAGNDDLTATQNGTSISSLQYQTSQTSNKN